MLSATDIAERFGVPAEALRKRLTRWMRDHHTEWIEVANPRPNDSKYLFDLVAVTPVVMALKNRGSSRQTSSPKKSRR
jgi:hypothetical protein